MLIAVAWRIRSAGLPSSRPRPRPQIFRLGEARFLPSPQCTRQSSRMSSTVRDNACSSVESTSLRRRSSPSARYGIRRYFHHQARAGRCTIPSHMPAPDWNKSHFKDTVDPEDNNFRVVELRLPHDSRTQPNYGPFKYFGIAARERIRRFAAAFLHGLGDISARDAERIIRKSHAADAKHGN